MCAVQIVVIGDPIPLSTDIDSCRHEECQADFGPPPNTAAGLVSAGVGHRARFSGEDGARERVAVVRASTCADPQLACLRVRGGLLDDARHDEFAAGCGDAAQLGRRISLPTSTQDGQM